MIRNVVKRAGEVERYDRDKIYSAVSKAYTAALPGISPEDLAARAGNTTSRVEAMIDGLMAGRHPNSIPAIEEIQDLVENALVEERETATAKAYILYRARHEAMRDAKKLMLDIDSTMDGYLQQ